MVSNRVLIVDDALIMRARIKDIAQGVGWEIAGEAANGEEAVALFEQLAPDLVTLDIVMPVMDGVSALKRMLAASPGARVVMISAVDQREKLTECIESGAVDFVVKPFERTRLEDLFEKYMTP